MDLFVTAAAGTEVALKEELRELGVRGPKADRGGVRAQGGMDAVARICIGSRVAVRVLIEVARFDCPDEHALYRGIQEVDWSRFVTPDHTIAVTAIARDSALRHTNYIAQKTKDAVVDAQRVVGGRRSSVEGQDPDLAIFVHLKKNHAGVFVDASGQSLHMRGYRARAGEAPLKETLAAAMLRISGWDRERTLLDPMCGSGTLPIEADLGARGVPAQPPGKRFGFERWASHDAEESLMLSQVRAALVGAARADGPRCLGSDVDPNIVEIAKDNARKAGSIARFKTLALADFEPPSEPFHIVSNPPYGARLGADARFWSELRAMIARADAHPVSLLLPEDAPSDLASGRRATAHRLQNGALRCALVTWDPITPGRRMRR